MKAFFLTGSILCTVLILIVAFENMGLSCAGFLYVFIPFDSPFFMTIAIAFTGVFTGVFYSGLFMHLLRNKAEDEDAPNEW